MGGSALNPIGGSPPAKPESEPDVRIVEPGVPDGAVVVNPAGGGAEFFASGNPKVDELNNLTVEVFRRSPSLGQFQTLESPRYEFKFSGWAGSEPSFSVDGDVVTGKVLANGKIMLDKPISRRNPDGSVDIVDIIEQGSLFPGRNVEVKEVLPPEPTSDPHAALLNPKRKMRLAE